MFRRWKTTLNALSTAERTRLCDAQEKAERLAVEVNCAERCVRDPVGIADCSDIRVALSRFMWKRSGGRILVVFRVWLEPDDRYFECKWRLLPTKTGTNPRQEGG